MDLQQTLPKRKHAETIAEKETKAQKLPQDETLLVINDEWEEAHFGIPL
jgi:hypothetical protein